jgi:phasin
MRVMNETTIGASKAKTATGWFDMSQFEIPKMELPAEFRAMTDKGIAHARDTCAKAKAASEEAADLLERMYATVAKGATDYNLKLIEIARINTRAAFDYAHELLDAKSPSEFIELSTVHIRKQFDLVTAQNKELCALAQEIASEGRRAKSRQACPRPSVRPPDRKDPEISDHNEQLSK